MFFLKLFFKASAFCIWLIPSLLLAAVVGPNNYLTVLAKADPGTVIQLAPGNYTGGLPIIGLNGTADKPIIIKALDSLRPPRFLAKPGKNTVSIIDASYIQLRNLIFDGRDLPVDAIKAEGYAHYAHHITLEGLTIINHGLHQGIVGISTKCPAWNWIIRHNVIVRAGTGLYLGDSDGNAPFFGGIIENNLVYDSLGYDLQIKHQLPRNLKVTLPLGPHMTIIRHNVFSKLGNASSHRMARPNVLVGHFPLEGHGVDDRYLVYGNFFYMNATEALFQGEGNVALYSNLFVNKNGDAIHIQPHNDKPKNIWVFHNTILASAEGVRFTGQTEEYLRLFAGNIIFDNSLLNELDRDNFTGLFPQKAEEYLTSPFAILGHINLKPKNVRSKIVEKACKLSEAFVDADKDFDGLRYQQCNIGAYSNNSSAPKWLPGLTFKPSTK